MVKFYISIFRNFTSSPSLNKFPDLHWLNVSSSILLSSFRFKTKIETPKFWAVTLSFQLPKFGRIKMLLGLSAALHSIR